MNIWTLIGVAGVVTLGFLFLYFWLIYPKLNDYHSRPGGWNRDPYVYCKTCETYHNMARVLLIGEHKLTWDDPNHPPR